MHAHPMRMRGAEAVRVVKPVKHGYVARPKDWPFLVHRDARYRADVDLTG